jgi:Ala-tRNA(Pro) deacylase
MMASGKNPEFGRHYSSAIDGRSLGRIPMLGLDCELRTFKVGINNVHSRGDREEVFGGIGQPSKGCFVGAIWFWLSLQDRREKNSSAISPTIRNFLKKLRPRLSPPSVKAVKARLLPLWCAEVYNPSKDLGERSTPMSVSARLKSFLDANRVRYESLSHSTTYTAQGTATVMQISGREMAKTVVLRAGENERETILAVLPGPKHVNLDKLAKVLGTPVRLATELEFSELFPDCELGAMPPFGALYDLPVYVEESLAKDKEVVFNAGTHRDVVRMTYEDFIRLAKPKICLFV